jgi:hypothetical protein
MFEAAARWRRQRTRKRSVQRQRKNRRLDRVRVGVTKTITLIRNGQSLHPQFDHRRGPLWSLINGTQIADEVARLVITNANVTSVGDTLFHNLPCKSTATSQRRTDHG